MLGDVEKEPGAFAIMVFSSVMQVVRSASEAASNKKSPNILFDNILDKVKILSEE